MKITKTIFEKIKYAVFHNNNQKKHPLFSVYEPIENPSPLKLFVIITNGELIEHSINLIKEEAQDHKPHSWWLENPEARVIELELVEKQHG
jgi:hypothetical protein